METCVRGFSFMIPDRHDNPDSVDLHFIEDDELERKWKATRRERNKQQEEKIWAEFVKEKDIVKSVCSDDKYQFLDQLSEVCLKDMMEFELEKIKKEVAAEEEAKDALFALLHEPFTAETPSVQSNNDEESPGHTCVVSFADANDSLGADMLQLFNDEKDDLSDGEGVLNESFTSLPTVREIKAESSANNDARSNKTSSTDKSSAGNVTSVIESSIYCAKVKDLRVKINYEILNMISTLDRRDVFAMSLEDMSRMIKRASEFSTRFTRIYVYQLQRQMHDIKRHSVSLPFAKHTQFQSQMVRIVSLHLNLLQSYQVFRKSAETSWCVRDSVSALGALIGATRAATAHCAAVKQPKNLAGAHEIYNDNLLESCDKLEEFVNEYTLRCEEFLNSCENTQAMAQKSPKFKKPKTKKKPLTGMPSSQKSNAKMESQLSMYSLDTIRLNTKGSRNQKNRCPKSPKLVKDQKKCSRRPLMRDPSAGLPKPVRLRAPQDNDIPTLVESIETYFSPRDRSPATGHNETTNVTPSPRVVCSKEAFKKAWNSPRALRKKVSNTNSPKPVLCPPPILEKPKPKLVEQRTPKEIAPKEIAPKEIAPKEIPKELTPNNSRENTISEYYTEDASLMNITQSDALHKPSAQTVCSQMNPVSKIKCSIKKPGAVEKENQKVNASDENKPRSRFPSPIKANTEAKRELDRSEALRPAEDCEVSQLLKQLCSGDANGSTERISGVRNALLVHVNSFQTRGGQPSTPQLLRILEETIQKKVPKPHYNKTMHHLEKHRLSFNLSDEITENMFKYRTKFVQHMLTSPMYANSAVGNPWEMIGRISDHIINEVIMNCVKEMQLNDVLREMLLQEST